MDNQTLILILIAVGVLLAAGLLTWYATRIGRSRKLREKFGPEYDYTMEKEGDRRTAEEILLEREKRVNKLDIQPLDPNTLDRYQAEWAEIQADFVDKPLESVKEANRLIIEVMVSRGFPVADFEQRSADISVLYPDFVSNYRNAHAIAVMSQNNGTSTEDLRQAMVYYRSLFEELLETEKTTEMEVIVS